MNIDFTRAWTDLFVTERKWMTILGICVCSLIPVAGYMVVLGYLTRRFMRERQGLPPEDFEFNYFTEYLNVGLWPTLVILVLSLVFIPVASIFMTPVFFAAPLMENSPDLAVALMIGGIVLYFGRS